MKTRDIATLVGGELIGDSDLDIVSVADIATAGAGQLAFFDSHGEPPATDAACLIVRKSSVGSVETTPQRNRLLSLIVTPEPKFAFAVAAASILSKDIDAEWHETAQIDPSSRPQIRAHRIGAYVSISSGTAIGIGSVIHDGARIGRNVSIGADCEIFPNCVINDDAIIGDRAVLHPGSIIGADGFGFVKGPDGRYAKFPQIGRVVIGNDVEIGSNTCIDRGSLGDTTIGDGTKIDNLVQIAHNVSIGRNVVIAAQTGISGSTVVEDDCVIGGQVGMGDHATVKSGAVIGSQAGVLPGKIVRPGVWWGTPVQPLDDYKRQNAHIKGIERLKRKVDALTDYLKNMQE